VHLFATQFLGPPSQFAIDFLAGTRGPSISCAVLPHKTRTAIATGAFVDLFEAHKLKAVAAARAQGSYSSSRRAAPISMATLPDLPTPPTTWRAMVEFYKLCWPGFLPELLAYVPIMERIALLVSSQGFMIFDNVWRADVFENGVSFLRDGALSARIAVELQCVMAHHLRPAPDAAALSCGNCGRQHRAEECPSFALSFKSTLDPAGPRQRRGRSSSRKRARSLSDSSSPPPQPLIIQNELPPQARTATGQAQVCCQVREQVVFLVLPALGGHRRVSVRFVV
jgi:hypothetical protein